MAIREKANHKPVIDISGPDGNAFCLLGTANRLARQLGMNAEPILAEMKSGSYAHLVVVFDKHFHEYVDLEY